MKLTQKQGLQYERNLFEIVRTLRTTLPLCLEGREKKKAQHSIVRLDKN